MKTQLVLSCWTPAMNASMKILAIVITYFPDSEMLRRNVDAFRQSVSKVLVWENTPQPEASAYRFVEGPDIEYCGGLGNVGIPTALNYAWRYAREHGFDYVLTMDQDSRWTGFDQFLEATVGAKSFAEDRSVWGPNAWPEFHPALYTTRDYLITSGMLVPVAVLNAVGGWPETFKIDCVDMDFSYHCRHHGVTLYLVNRGFLHQQFGSTKRVRSLRALFLKKIDVTVYPARRWYGTLRNGIIMHKKYADFPLRGYLHDWICVRGRHVLLYEDHKLSKFYQMFRGIVAGMSYRLKSQS